MLPLLSGIERLSRGPKWSAINSISVCCMSLLRAECERSPLCVSVGDWRQIKVKRGNIVSLYTPCALVLAMMLFCDEEGQRSLLIH